jgi:hypothetical protein
VSGVLEIRGYDQTTDRYRFDTLSHRCNVAETLLCDESVGTFPVEPLPPGD